MCCVTYCRIAVCGFEVLTSAVVTTELWSVVSEIANVKIFNIDMYDIVQYISYTGSKFTVYMTYRK